MHEAMFYEKLSDGKVQCRLCPHRCRIADGSRGLCGVRESQSGTLFSLVFGKSIAEHADPIEKKPLFHMLPGSRSYSIATAGCNLRCRHCQNAEISQMPRGQGAIMGQDRSPDDIVGAALRAGCRSIAFTYTEPTIYFEYALETARRAKLQGLATAFVSNGFTGLAAIEAVAPFLDAANIDLKAFSESFYRDICGARLQPVLEAIRRYRQLGVWLEVTTLIIPGLNDGFEELRQIADFIVSVGPEIPWHVTAYYPTYRLTDRPRTPASALLEARRIGHAAGLHYVYTGNIPGEDGESTVCRACGALLIQRFGFSIRQNRLQDDRCPECGVRCDGLFAGRPGG